MLSLHRYMMYELVLCILIDYTYAYTRVVIDLVCKHVLYEYSGVVFVCSYEGHTTLLARV